jgi:hypothetical protein
MTRDTSTAFELFTARFSPDAKRRLMALAQIQQAPAYQILEDMFWTCWNGLPARDRKAVEAILQLIDDARANPSG